MIRILQASTFFLIALTSCHSYTEVQVKDPVDINPSEVVNIKNVAILNRTAVPKGSGGTNVFEGIITGESVNADRDGARKCIDGLSECLKNSLNYKKVEVVSTVFYGGSTATIPKPLPWGLVDSLCKAYNTDALVSLDFFDSDAGLSLVLNPVMPYGAGTNTNNVSVKTYWRYYDNVNKRIIDDFELKSHSSNGRYRSPFIHENIMERYNVTQGTGNWAGFEYGFRISEQWVPEGRTYFRTGNHAMKQAARLASVGDWDKASVIWTEQMLSHKRKIRARAMHNLGVYYNRLGDLDQALEMAKMAYALKAHSSSFALVNAIHKQISNQQRFLSNIK